MEGVNFSTGLVHVRKVPEKVCECTKRAVQYTIPSICMGMCAHAVPKGARSGHIFQQITIKVHGILAHKTLIGPRCWPKRSIGYGHVLYAFARGARGTHKT